MRFLHEGFFDDAPPCVLGGARLRFPSQVMICGVKNLYHASNCVLNFHGMLFIQLWVNLRLRFDFLVPQTISQNMAENKMSDYEPNQT